MTLRDSGSSHLSSHKSNEQPDENHQNATPSSIMKAFHDRVSIAMTVWLTVLWLLLFGKLNWLHILSGFILALIVQILFPLPKITRNWRVRIIPCLIWIARFMWDVARAGIQVAWIVLRNRSTQDAIIRVDMYSSNPVHLTIQSAMISLIPGSLVLRVNRLSGVLYLHVLDLPGQGGAMAMRKAIHAQEKRMLWAIAPISELPQSLWPSKLKTRMFKDHATRSDQRATKASIIDLADAVEEENDD